MYVSLGWVLVFLDPLMHANKRKCFDLGSRLFGRDICGVF